MVSIIEAPQHKEKDMHIQQVHKRDEIKNIGKQTIDCGNEHQKIKITDYNDPPLILSNKEINNN